ncbi:MAG TPA: 16S rRNA (uracil(1498)-N(3))-methyltransferase [Gammaproteobacteria bacterium]|nr:16S rRNA (uracil(1498)-N(3))-methyltransferase [Gammaproteobacteria bacterium]
MGTPRIYVDSALAPGINVILDERNYHHLVHVLRMQNEAEVMLFNNRGGEYSGRLRVEKKTAKVEVLSFQDTDRESKLKLHLAQAVSRGDRMDITLQKAVELGVTEISPLYSERSQKMDARAREKKMAHWRGIVISACEQSGRCALPLLNEPISLAEWLDTHRKDDAAGRFILDPEATGKFSPRKLDLITLLTGPEGGFSRPEIELAERHGCAPVRLGPRILRTETAGIVALTACQALSGDLLK